MWPLHNSKFSCSDWVYSNYSLLFVPTTIKLPKFEHENFSHKCIAIASDKLQDKVTSLLLHQEDSRQFKKELRTKNYFSWILYIIDCYKEVQRYQKKYLQEMKT